MAKRYTRIDSVTFEGYRVYKDETFELEKTREEDLHIIVGKMGTGKTTFLNGISYLLYNRELTKSEVDGKPIHYTGIFEEGISRVPMSIRMTVSRGLNQWILERKVWLKKVGDSVAYTDPKVSVKTPDEMEEDFTQWLDNFIPQKVSHFFFFDGEALEKYFTQDKREDVQTTIKDLLRYDRLKKLYEDLTAYINEQTGRISIKDNKLAQLYRQLEDYDREVHEHIERKSEIRVELSSLNKKLKEYKEIANSTYDLSLKMKEKELKEEELNQKMKMWKEKLSQWNIAGVKLYILALAKPYMKDMQKKIEERESADAVIPGLSDFIRYAIDKGRCPICQRDLSAEEINNLKVRLKDIATADATQILYGIFQRSYGRATRLLEDRDSILLLGKEVAELEEDIENLKRQKAKLAKDIKRHLPEEVNKVMKEIPRINQQIEKLIEEREQIDKRINELKTRIQRIKNAINKNESRVRDIDMVRKKLTHALALREDLEKLMNRIMSDSTRELSQRATYWFRKMMWKENAFKEVKITDDFEVQVLDDKGANVIGSLSGGENQILALAYTLALHDVMHLESPVIIDRPTANISGDSTEFVMNVLADISKERQIILLLNDKDWEQVRKYVENRASTIWVLEHDDATSSTVAKKVA